MMLLLQHNYIIIDGEGKGGDEVSRLRLINDLYSSVFEEISGSEQG